jgi:hypothetical protein
MASIYLSYRPGDDDAVAGRLYDALVERFGSDAVLWRETATVETASGLRDAVVVVALIGPRWLRGAGGSANDAPLTSPADPVRLELEAAVGRQLPIIPVLAPGAARRLAPYLPPGLRPLAGLTAMQLRNDPDFHRDVERLGEALGRYVAPLSATRGVRRLSVQAFALIAALALLVIALSVAGVVFAAHAGIGSVSIAATTPTPTPIIHRTPTPVTVVHDPLTSQVTYSGFPGAWAVNFSGQCGFVARGYQVIGSPRAGYVTLCGGPAITAGGDERLSVTTRLTTNGAADGRYGVYFRSSDSAASTGYYFAITPAGKWALLDAKTGNTLASGTSSAIHTGTGATNTLMVDAYGALITLSVNTTRVGQISDDSYASGQCGFFAEHGLTVLYTNFTMQRYD